MSAGRVVERLFEGSLRSFPRAFRARHGGMMRAMFRAQWRERTGRHVLRRVSFLATVLLDLVRSGIAERFASFRASRRSEGMRPGGPVRGRQSRELFQAARTLGRRPAFTLLAVGTLALGIGGVASIGSVAYHVLFKPLPYASGDEIVRLWWNGAILMPQLTDHFSVSSGMLEHFAANNRTAREWTWVSSRDEAQMQTDEGTEIVATGAAAPNFFTFLGVVPELGRLDVPDEPGATGLVLNHAEWVRRWGADPSIVGRSLRFQNAAWPVIGVLPADFEWVGRTTSTGRADYWLITRAPSRDGYYRYYPLVKPAAGLTMEDVRLDFGRSAYADISRRQEPRLPMTEAATAEMLRENTVGSLRVRLSLLFGSVLFVVLLGALSVSNLLLGRLAERDHEMGVRLSLGASRLDLARLIAIETTLIAAAGGLLGILLARWGLELIKVSAPVGIPRLASATISMPILFSVVVVTTAIGLIVLVPAARGVVSDTVDGMLRINDRTRHRSRSRRFLIFSEMAIATVLLIGGTLMLRSLHAMATADLGFDADDILAARFQLPSSYWIATQGVSEVGRPVRIMSNTAALVADLDRFRERIAAIAGVKAVAFAQSIPLSGSYGTWLPFVPEGQEETAVIDENAAVNANIVDERFFDVMNVTLLEGRTFRKQDELVDPPTVAVVSDRLAARYWPGESAIGKRFKYLYGDPSGEGRVARREIWIEVVGVVGGLRERGLEAVDPTLYVPRTILEGPTSHALTDLAVLVSTSGDPASIMPAMRRTIAESFPGQPLQHFAPLKTTVAGLMTGSRFYTTLLSVFAAYGMLLALVGIVGVIRHQISRREREAAIRMAFGAMPREVLGLLGRETGWSALLGITAGLLISAGLARLIESMLFEVVPLDPWTFATIPALFFGAAIAASVVPGRRLNRLRLLDALRSE